MLCSGRCMLIYRVSMYFTKLTVILIVDSNTAMSFRYDSCPAFIMYSKVAFDGLVSSSSI